MEAAKEEAIGLSPRARARCAPRRARLLASNNPSERMHLWRRLGARAKDETVHVRERQQLARHRAVRAGRRRV